MRDRGEHAPARGRLAVRAPALRALARFWLCLLIVFSASAPVLAADPEDGATELAVQAAFLFKFGSYVEWPATAFRSPHAPFHIAVIGADELATTLRAISAGRSVMGRPVIVESLQPGASPDGPHVVFIGDTEALAETIAALQGKPALVVTKADAGLADGSMINFVVTGGRLRFDVSLGAAGVAGLRFSSRLLAVARRVTGSHAGDGDGDGDG